MNPSNTLRKMIILLLAIILQTGAAANVAAYQEFTQTYNSGPADSLISCRAAAGQMLRKKIYSSLADQVRKALPPKLQTAFTPSILFAAAPTRRTSETWNGATYSLKAELTADVNTIAANVTKLLQDGVWADDLKNAWNRAEAAQNQLIRFNRLFSRNEPAGNDLIAYAIWVNKIFAEQYFAEGVLLAQSQNHQQAIKSFNWAIMEKPDHAHAFLARGEARLNAQKSETPFEAASIYHGGRAEEPIQAGAPLESYTNPGEIEVYSHFAFSGQGLNEKAIEDFSQALRFEPDLARAYLLRGRAYEKDGQYGKALTDYEQYVKLAPRDPQGRVLVDRVKKKR